MRNKGITLISLVVTIIVLLLLAGISISMLNGNNSILNKAGEAQKYTTIESEKEALSLAFTSLTTDKATTNKDRINSEELKNEILKYGYSTSVTGSGTLTVTFLNTNHRYTIHTNGNIKYEEPIYYASDNSNINNLKIMSSYIENDDENLSEVYYIYILKESGNLFRYRYTDNIGTINLNNLEFVDSNIQEYNGNYFLKKDKNLYDKQGNIIGKNVKEFENNIFLTHDNTLYLIEEMSSIKVADNVKKYSYNYYLTNNNELYTYNYINNSQINTRKVLENVKEAENAYSIITYTNEAYKIIHGDNNYEVEKTNENVIQTGNSYYLTTENKLKNIWNASFNVDNVKSFEEFWIAGVIYCTYKTQDNNEYFIRGSASAEEIPQYTKFENGYYTTGENKLYCIRSGDFVLKENVDRFGVIDSASENYWCQLSNGTIYYDLQSRFY